MIYILFVLCSFFLFVALWKLLLINFAGAYTGIWWREDEIDYSLANGIWQMINDILVTSECCHFHGFMGFVWDLVARKEEGKKCVISSSNSFLLPFAIVKTFIQFSGIEHF